MELSLAFPMPLKVRGVVKSKLMLSSTHELEPLQCHRPLACTHVQSHTYYIIAATVIQCMVPHTHELLIITRII